jgi:hypothetical protein
MSVRPALLAVLLLAAAAYAATWVVWAPIQNNSPPSVVPTTISSTGGGSSTFGNYWGYGAAFYSTAAVNWIVPPMLERGSAAFYNITSYLGTSGAASIYATSSQTTSSYYMYAGAVSNVYTTSLGSSTSISSTSGIFALAAVSISSEYCGSLYFVESFTTSSSTYPSIYVVAELANSTWAYLAFTYYSYIPPGATTKNQALPNACYSPGTYLLAVSIYIYVGSATSVTAVQVSTSSSGTGASYVPGKQYALSISPAAGDTVVFPWTTSASPYVVLMSAASIYNTGGSPSSGYFSIAGTSPVYLPPSALLFRDSSASTPSIAAANCPQNVYFLPASASLGIFMTCSGMSAPSSTSVYPTDYAKYSNTPAILIPFSIPGGSVGNVSLTVSYTDSAGSVYSATVTTSNQIAVYVTSASLFSPYAAYVRNQTAAGGPYYVPAPAAGWAYVGPAFLASPTISGAVNITVSLYPMPSASVYQSVTLNGTALRLPFSPSATSYTIAFYQVGGDVETFGVTPNGPPGAYFMSSNTTSYTVPGTPHSSTLVVPTTAGVFFARFLGDWWNATGRPLYAAALVNGTGAAGPFTVKVAGASVSASYFAWDGANPPNAVIYFTGVDGLTYAFNPAWAEGAGVQQIFAGGKSYTVPVVLGRVLTSATLAYTAGGAWLNMTSAGGSFTTKFALPAFAFPNAQVFMYANGTARPKYLTAVLAVVNGKLQQYAVQYLNATVWGNTGALLGSAAISNFTFIGFAANGSLAPIWALLNGTVGVPPVLFSYFPSVKYLMMPSTASAQYASVQVGVGVPSQLVNIWSGNLVFAAAQMAVNGYYALMSGGFYSSPPTSFAINLPASAVGQIAFFLMASWPSGGTCTILQQLSNPLELTICQGAASQNIAVNLGTATVSSPAFADLPGAWAGLAGRIAPTSAILANAGVAALVILMIRRGRSLTAGLMTAGALVTALGLSLWLPWMIGEGAVMFVIASAVAFTRR